MSWCDLYNWSLNRRLSLYCLLNRKNWSGWKRRDELGIKVFEEKNSKRRKRANRRLAFVGVMKKWSWGEEWKRQEKKELERQRPFVTAQLRSRGVGGGTGTEHDKRWVSAVTKQGHSAGNVFTWKGTREEGRVSHSRDGEQEWINGCIEEQWRRHTRQEQVRTGRDQVWHWDKRGREEGKEKHYKAWRTTYVTNRDWSISKTFDIPYLWTKVSMSRPGQNSAE